MSERVTVTKGGKLGFGFADGTDRTDEYEKRFLVFGNDSAYRHLTDVEVLILKSNLNTADSWDNILVQDPFDPLLISATSFYGKVRIAGLENVTLKFHDFEMRSGITHSLIISSDIGKNCCIHYVRYMSHYIVHDECILHSIDEMQCTNHSKFGNGIVKTFESEDVRVSLAIMNENEGRAIAPFEDLIPADAMLWAYDRTDDDFVRSLWRLTDSSYSREGLWYGEVGQGSVIKGCGIIKDVKFGPATYAKGCNKLKNLTVKSRYEEPVQLGEGIELVNGIVGPGCRVFYGCKGVRFVMCEGSSLKYGARLINSVLGDNSTISCCEVLSNLVFPFHEQHHNNSFLISSLVMGQSNMAAGANIGSNHNSRSADGEMRAGRGFWPALSSTIKFDSRFASFVIITKGNYNYELNITLPFSLLSDNTKKHCREIMPAYWWMYNMYALERNCAKFAKRDKRKVALQHIETDYLAPDTAEEIIRAIGLLEGYIAESEKKGEEEVLVFDLEHSKTPVRILKPHEALSAYKTMLKYYALKTLVEYCSSEGVSVSSFCGRNYSVCRDWVNLGGQLVPGSKVESLKARIKRGEFAHWNDVHAVYDEYYSEYHREKASHALFVLKEVLGAGDITAEKWAACVEDLKEIRSFIDAEVYKTRAKDYSNPFRQITYSSLAERDAVLGKIEENAFVFSSKAETERLLSLSAQVKF